MTSPHPHPRPVERLIDEFSRLPGIGRRSAERMAFHLLKSSQDEAMKLANAVSEMKSRVRPCSICFCLTDDDPCGICTSEKRDATTILVVEQPKDVISLKSTGMYQGVYHVLMGRLDSLSGVEPENLTIESLLKRVDDATHNCRSVEVKEIILGLNPDMEGDGTALYLADEFARRSIQITRLARGLPTGSQLEFASKAVLADAIQGRQPISPVDP